MTIERTSKEVIIRLPASADTKELENFMRYARYKDLTSKFKVSQKEADELVKEVKKGWWAKNRERLLKNH